MAQTYLKDPDATLDYKFDWANTTNGGTVADWLASGETIASFVIDADTGITVASSSRTDTNTSVTVWLSGGTAGNTYAVRCEITTDNSTARKDERTIYIQVVER